MKTKIKQKGGQRAFTIIELLTVMSVIVLLISILVPALNTIRRYAKQVKQKAQFHAIEVSMDLFNAENEEYPSSQQFDSANVQYCGAMKLAEAMIGQDKLGFHQNSKFLENGKDGMLATSNPLYYLDPATPPNPALVTYKENMRFRKDYLTLTNANAYRLGDIYASFGSFPRDSFNNKNNRFVLCDVYGNVNNLDPAGLGKAKIGMPVLYYRANTSKLLHDPLQPGDSIYDYRDNDELVKLGIPFSTTGAAHPIASTGTDSAGQPADPQKFYDIIKDKQVTITTVPRPQNSKSYILMSAGFDGEYGTSDDIFNF